MNKENNKGFTLIELIVSVAILAIITAPFLNAFVISAKNNAEANVRQRVTNYAESVMEKFKAQSFDMISKKFTLIDTGAIDGYQGQNYYYYDNVDQKYVFNLNAEETTGRTDSSYSATVEMKPQTYEAPDMTDIDSQNTAILISEIFKYDNEGLNSLYSQLSGINDLSKFSIYQSGLEPSVISNNIAKNAVRTVFIYVTYDGTLGTRPFEVSTSVAYELTYGNGTVSKVYNDVFKNAYETVPDVLLFYSMYENGSVTTINDKIVVDNQIPDDIISASGKKCKVYISNQSVALQNGKSLTYRNDANSNILFREGGNDNYLTDSGNNKLENNNTEAYMSNAIYDSTGVNAINTLVGSKESVKLYEITVNIFWDGKLKTSVKSATDSQN